MIEQCKRTLKQTKLFVKNHSSNIPYAKSYVFQPGAENPYYGKNL